MRRVLASPAAVRDLEDIWDYIAERNPGAADRLIDRIQKVLPKLASLPGMGHQRADVSDPRYRFWVVRPYLIAYRFDESSLTVVRVIHGRRNVRQQMRGHRGIE